MCCELAGRGGWSVHVSLVLSGCAAIFFPRASNSPTFNISNIKAHHPAFLPVCQGGYVGGGRWEGTLLLLACFHWIVEVGKQQRPPACRHVLPAFTGEGRQRQVVAWMGVCLTAAHCFFCPLLHTVEAGKQQ